MILTTEPNALCAPVYNRMPVILAQDDWPRWLGAPEDCSALLRPFPAERMVCWPVGRDIGIVRNDRADLIKPPAA